MVSIFHRFKMRINGINTSLQVRYRFYLIAFKFFGWKKALVIVLLGGVAVGLADLSSKYLFKEVFLRYRPSHNLLLKDKIHLVNNYRGGMYGFVSSHSANMFAIVISLGAFF